MTDVGGGTWVNSGSKSWVWIGLVVVLSRVCCCESHPESPKKPSSTVVHLTFCFLRPMSQWNHADLKLKEPNSSPLSSSFYTYFSSSSIFFFFAFLTTNSLCLSTKPDRRSSSSFSFFDCKEKKNYFVKMKFWMSISQKQINIFYWFIRDILSLQNVFCFLNISKAFLTFSPWILTFDISWWNKFLF